MASSSVPPTVLPWLNKLLFLRGAAYFFLPSVLPASYHWLLRLLGFQPDAEQARTLLAAAAAQGGVVALDEGAALENVQRLVARAEGAVAQRSAPSHPTATASTDGTPPVTFLVEAAPSAPLAVLILVWVQGFFVRDVRAADRLLAQSMLQWRRVRGTHAAAT